MEIDLTKFELTIILNQESQVIKSEKDKFILLDHRTGLTLYGIEKMLQGDLLEEFIQEYQRKIYENKIQELMEKEAE